MLHLLDKFKKYGVIRLDVTQSLTIYRLSNGARWRRSVDGRHLGRTAILQSAKNRSSIQCESGGEYSCFRLLEIWPFIRSFREQNDLVHVLDEFGELYAIPDATCEDRAGNPVWIEFKYTEDLDADERGRLKRIARAFARSGLRYEVLNSRFTQHPIIRANVTRIYRNRYEPVEAAWVSLVAEKLERSVLPLGALATLFPEHEFPEATICGMMAQGWLELDLETVFHPATTLVYPLWHPDLPSAKWFRVHFLDQGMGR